MCNCGSSFVTSKSFSISDNTQSNCINPLSYYENILLKVESQLNTNNFYSLYLNIVKSQINIYNNSCNNYENYIRNTIIPLLV